MINRFWDDWNLFPNRSTPQVVMLSIVILVSALVQLYCCGRRYSAALVTVCRALSIHPALLGYLYRFLMRPQCCQPFSPGQSRHWPGIPDTQCSTPLHCNNIPLRAEWVQLAAIVRSPDSSILFCILCPRSKCTATAGTRQQNCHSFILARLFQSAVLARVPDCDPFVVR